MYLLCHLRAANNSLFVLLVVLLELEDLIGWLLGEELDCNPLVIHSYFRLASNISPGESITDTSRAIFIFLDSVDELVASFDINLTCFNDFLKNLGIFSG